MASSIELAEPMVHDVAEDMFEHGGAHLFFGDALDLYEHWPAPTAIVSDGAYGVEGFPGDPADPAEIADWYRPHIKEWSEHALPETTLWFWNTEVGWATVHPILLEHGWEYVGLNIWNKGIAHIAGNSNTQRMRHFPKVTEVCAQYVKPPRFDVDGEHVSMKRWLRHEWQRSGLPLYRANDACGVSNAATRKYLTQCHLWYFPPPEMFQKMADYLQEHGDPEGRPYYSLDGKKPLTAADWQKMRSKFELEAGVTNVWDLPALRGKERIKTPKGVQHPNQKPLKLMRRTVRSVTDPGDVVWEPFGGLCSASFAANELGRRAFAAEVIRDFFELAKERFTSASQPDNPGAVPNDDRTA